MYAVNTFCFGVVGRALLVASFFFQQDMVADQFRAFCYLSRARRLVMAHSTFSWWVAFLGNATEIHFPLTAHGRGVTGPNIVVTGDPRYVYRDDDGRIVSP